MVIRSPTLCVVLVKTLQNQHDEHGRDHQLTKTTDPTLLVAYDQDGP